MTEQNREFLLDDEMLDQISGGSSSTETALAVCTFICPECGQQHSFKSYIMTGLVSSYSVSCGKVRPQHAENRTLFFYDAKGAFRETTYTAIGAEIDGQYYGR